MSNSSTPHDTEIGYAVSEYERLEREALASGEKFDKEATLRALAAKTNIPMDTLMTAVSSDTAPRQPPAI
jgi:hypothetical protein